MSKGLIITIVILVVLGAGLYIGYRNLVEAGYESCVLSLEDGIANAIGLAGIRDKIPVTDEWRSLSEDEERLIFVRFKAMGVGFDCKNFIEYANGDIFRGEHGRINVRLVDGWVRVRVEIDDGRVRKYTPQWVSPPTKCFD